MLDSFRPGDCGVAEAGERLPLLVGLGAGRLSRLEDILRAFLLA